MIKTLYAKRYALLILKLFLLISCQENPKTKIQNELLQWQGKEILFPEKLFFYKVYR